MLFRPWITGAGLCSLFFTVGGIVVPASYPEFEGFIISATTVDPVTRTNNYQYRAVLYETVQQYSYAQGKSYLLGSFTSYSGDTYYFEGGDVCANNVARGGSATFSCGSTSSVTVVEHPTCRYTMSFVDPKLCPSVPTPTSSPIASGQHPNFVPAKYYPMLGTVVKETTGGFEYVFNLFGLVTQYSLQEKKMYTLGTISSYSSNSNDFFFTNGDTTGCRFARSGKIYLNCNSRVYSTVSESSCFYSVILNSPDYCVADTPSLTSEPTLAPVGLRNSSHAGGTNIIGTVVGMLFAISFVVGIVVCVRKIRFKSSRVHYAPNIAIELPTHGANYYRPQQPPGNMPYNNASIASAPNYPNRYEQVSTQQPQLQPQYEQPLFTSHNIPGDTPYSGYPPAYVPPLAGHYRSYGQQPQQQFSAQQVVTAVAVPYNIDERAIPVATAVVIS